MANQIDLDEASFGIYFDRSRIPGYQGSCYLRLCHPDAALQSLQEALKPLDLSGALARAVILDIAEASIQAALIEQACHYLEQALSLIVRTQSSLQRLSTLRMQLEPWEAVQQVKDLDAQLYYARPIA